MKKNLFLFVQMIVIILIMVSCKGDTGPQGPAGPQGAQGSQGAQGAAGPAGTANVIYSAWIQTTLAGWVASNPGTGIDHYNFSATAPGITNTVITNGAVFVYMRTDHYNSTAIWPANTVTQLPYTLSFAISGTLVIDTWTPFLTAGNLRVNFTNSFNFLKPYAIMAPVSYPSFRYIIVPGGIAGGRIVSGNAAGYSVEQLKQMRYEQICSLLDIPKEGSNVK